MELALAEAIANAAEAPGFATFIVVGGFALWVAFSRRVIVPGEVAALQAELAGVKAGEAACQQRCLDLEKRIGALELQLSKHLEKD